MAEHVVETLQQSPGIHRVEAQLLTHQAGHLASIFSSSGFQRYRRLFLSLPLSGRDAPQVPPLPLPHDTQVRPWMEQDYQPAAGVITAAYRGHIDSEINDQYRTHAGSIRFLNNIVRFPGCGVFDPQASFSAVHRPSNMTFIQCLRASRPVAGPPHQRCRPPARVEGHPRRRCTQSPRPHRRAMRNNPQRSKRTGAAAVHCADAARPFDPPARLAEPGSYHGTGSRLRHPQTEVIMIVKPGNRTLTVTDGCR